MSWRGERAGPAAVAVVGRRKQARSHWSVGVGVVPQGTDVGGVRAPAIAEAVVTWREGRVWAVVASIVVVVVVAAAAVVVVVAAVVAAAFVDEFGGKPRAVGEVEQEA